MPRAAASFLALGLLVAAGGCGGGSRVTPQPTSQSQSSARYTDALLAPRFVRPAGAAEAEPPAQAGAAGEAEPEIIDDESPDGAEFEVSEPAVPRIHPLDDWTAERIADAVKGDIQALGPLSIGQPSAGALLNGVRAEASSLFELVDARNAYGTRETVEYLSAAIRVVQARYPGSPALSLGHISAPRGGPLRPHVSHQSGRDVDLSFYYRQGAHWYARASEKNLDLPRTWALVRALVTESDVEMILVDHSIQPLLRRQALSEGEDAAWVESLFEGVPGKLRAIVRHAPGHATHLHVRFFNPIAQESGRRAHPALVASGVAPQLSSFLVHRARRGETLGKIAKKYGTSVKAIQNANGLRNSRIRENRSYRIPVRARPIAIAGMPLQFPPRRLPPAAASPAAASPAERTP